MLEINKKEGKDVFKLASKVQTEMFGNTRSFNETEGPPLVLVGTLGHLEHETREEVLAACPEIKVLFPALHHPSCFGAHPNSEECALHICALREESERTSGC